jgi:hypothetical protein
MYFFKYRRHHHHHHPNHHHWKNGPLWAIVFLRRVCQTCLEVDHPVFNILDIATIFFFTEQSHQPFVPPPTWRTRSLDLYPPVIVWPSYTPSHRVPLSSPSTTRRATVEVFNPPPHGAFPNTNYVLRCHTFWNTPSHGLQFLWILNKLNKNIKCLLLQGISGC